MLYAPVYAALGVAAEITLAPDQDDETLYEFVVLDKTGGVEITLQGAETTTLSPAVVMRRADLEEVELSPADLRNALIEVNGVSWKVISYYNKPSPMGQLDGEIYLILTQGEAEA
jgi:hypothetical protein